MSKSYLTNHRKPEAEVTPYDFYSTNKASVRTFLTEYLKEHIINYAWECACGIGNISKVLEEYNIKHIDTDLIDRGYGTGGIDFLKQTELIDSSIDVIITNPPFKNADEFIKKSIELNSKYIILFGKITILEGKKRYNDIWSKYKPYRIYIHTSRQGCGGYGQEDFFNGGAAACFMWYIFNTQDYNKDPVIKWLPINS
jgi:hypothetical protein